MVDYYITDTAEKLATQGGDISGLDSRVAALEAEVARLEQDKLDIADAVAAFSFAAYADLTAPLDSAFPNLGAAWQKINILTISELSAPRGITIDLPNSRFAFDYDGIYQFALDGSMEHNDVNQGREFQIRTWNETAGTPGAAKTFGTGRNAAATNLSAVFLLEITDAAKGDWLYLEIGNGDTYSAINFQVLGLSINAEGEWREPLG